MMNQIKFRAWDTLEKRWVRGKQPENDELFLEETTPKTYEVTEWSCDLILWTGLQDKNGVDIYANDIVCWDNLRGGVVAPVVFEHNYGWHPQGLYNQNWCENSVVVGNIYENPELL